MASRCNTDDLRHERAESAAAAGQQNLDEEEALKRQEQDAAKREKTTRPDPAAPRAGRTGGLGTRAERPSDCRQPDEQGVSGPRGGKPPAPRAGGPPEDR
jgi:hypothetical protein